MPDIKFLFGESYRDAVKEIIRDRSDLRIAVSYWGREILSRLGLRERFENGGNNVKVICDLRHIACRREPIEEMVDANVPLKLLDFLHAKVWISDSQLIVGSANSSRSALHFTVLVRNTNEEAGLLIRDTSTIADAKRWFDERWNSQNSVCITPEEMTRKREEHPNQNDHLNQRYYPNETHRRTFEEFVGERAGNDFRRRLTDLEFVQNANRLLSIKYDEIDDMDSFVRRLVSALGELIDNAVGVNRMYGRESPIPARFLRDYGHERNTLHRHIADFVEGNEGRFLWINEGEGIHDLGFSLRIKHPRAGAKGISLLTINSNRMSAAGDR